MRIATKRFVSLSALVDDFKRRNSCSTNMLRSRVVLFAVECRRRELDGLQKGHGANA